MKVRVDDDSCIGDETCVEICPGIFEMKGDVAVIW
jgi:ferredoxin